MRLFIAEKPSVARELSQVLPHAKEAVRKDGYIVQGDDVITWAFGHMLEQIEPDEYDEKYKMWRMDVLPILPDQWKLKVKASSAKQFATITRLIQSATTIVNAGDPDREGQLLIDEMLDYVNCTKPVQRILLNALDEKSIRHAIDHMVDNKKYENLKYSALARSRADWLIGMNLSRAYTLEQRFLGRKVTFPVGRVKTPTLALVVRRERELQNFVPVEYYVLDVEYSHQEGNFWATWKPKDTQLGLDAEGHMVDESLVQELSKAVLEEPEGRISLVEKKKKKEGPRLPYSLSALQITAGKLFNYTPQEVLDGAQILYEKKYTTYPRSDCEYIPTNQFSDAPAILGHLRQCAHKEIAGWVQGTDVTIQSRAWNDKKVTAHHAIIPTTVKCPLHTLGKREQDLYFLIAQAYIAQFYKDHQYEQKRIEVTHKDEVFVATGRTILDMGWKELYKKGQKGDDEEEKQTILPAVRKGDTVEAVHSKVDKRKTKPPSRFTSATLVQAMKEIYKYVKDEQVKKQLKDVSGIGTEATRASIIDELISRKFLKEEGKKKVLSPTPLAYQLIDALPDELIYPDATAQWEERLALMSEGKESLHVFLQGQAEFITQLINFVKGRVNSGSNIMTDEIVHKGKSPTNRVVPSDAKDCSQCKTGKMILRTSQYGQFYGCSNFPKCKHTERFSESKNSGTSVGLRQEKDSVLKDARTAYACPRCGKGFLVQLKEGNQPVWKCSELEACRTTCADVDGVPAVYVTRTKV